MFEIGPIIVSVLGVFLVMAIGGLCRQTGWLTQQADTTLANLTANVMLPAYFIAQFVRSDQLDSLSTAWLPPLTGFLITTFGFVAAWIVAKTIGPWIGIDSESKQRAFALCAGICNYGYIPLPLAEEFYDQSVVIKLILHNVGVDLSLWSVGILVVTGVGSGGVRKALLSPPLLAVVFSIILRQSGLSNQIPHPILVAIGKLGNCAIPLGLLLSGAIIVDFLKTSKLHGGYRTIAAGIAFRQLLMPLVMLGIAGFLIRSTELRSVIVLQAAMPAAVFPIVLVRLYGQDTETALRVVLWTGLAGLFLIPLWIAAGTYWLG